MLAQEIVQEIKKLPLGQRIWVIEKALKSIREETVSEYSLEEGAMALLEDYLNDPELTAFTVLDAEDFYEAR